MTGWSNMIGNIITVTRPGWGAAVKLPRHEKKKNFKKWKDKAVEIFGREVKYSGANDKMWAD